MLFFLLWASIYDKGSRWAPIEKEHHLNRPPPWLWVQHVNFPGWIGRYIEIPYELVVLHVGDEKLPMLPVGFLSLIRHQNKDQIDGNYPQGIKGINTFLRNGTLLLPRCSIHGIFAYIWLKFLVHASKYSIRVHGANGFEDTKKHQKSRLSWKHCQPTLLLVGGHMRVRLFLIISIVSHMTTKSDRDHLPFTTRTTFNF